MDFRELEPWAAAAIDTMTGGRFLALLCELLDANLEVDLQVLRVPLSILLHGVASGSERLVADEAIKLDVAGVTVAPNLRPVNAQPVRWRGVTSQLAGSWFSRRHGLGRRPHNAERLIRRIGGPGAEILGTFSGTLFDASTHTKSIAIADGIRERSGLDQRGVPVMGGVVPERSRATDRQA